MLSPQLKAVAVSVGCVAALCVVTSSNGVMSTIEKAAPKQPSNNLEPLMEEAERSEDPLRGLISSVHTIATLTANNDTASPLMARAHRVRQSALSKLNY